MKMSMDNGVTWSKERPLSGIEGVLVKNKPYLSEGGVLLLPIYDEKSWRPGLCRSEDGGRHWRLWLLEEAPVPAIQGSIATDGLGTLHMFLRTRVGRAYDMASHDDGKSWTQPRRTNLLNPNSGLDALGLSPGKMMIVYNASRTVTADIMDPVQRDARTPLTVALSKDRGQTWHNLLHLEQGPGEYSYPALVRDPGGTTLHISYTYRRKAIRHVVLSGI